MVFFQFRVSGGGRAWPLTLRELKIKLLEEAVKYYARHSEPALCWVSGRAGAPKSEKAERSKNLREWNLAVFCYAKNFLQLSAFIGAYGAQYCPQLHSCFRPRLRPSFRPRFHRKQNCEEHG